ncbi:uncharacterized protein A4U43_C04F33360 [Asparagus officinalis]|nr:uncharacterized protein A4U43_C04F33360 [Asparagus officinalis]
MSIPNPLINTYISLIQSCLNSKNPFSRAKSIHSLIIKSGLLSSSTYLTNNLINLYSKLSIFSDAHQLFDEMPQPNIFSWNSVLSMYAKSSQPELAIQVFDKMPERDSVSYTAMIVGFNQTGRFNMALKTFSKMIVDGISPTQFTFTNILSSCTLKTEGIDTGKKLHSFIVKLGLSGYVPVANSLINMYGKAGDLRTGKLVFDRMSLRSVSSWNSMVSMYSQSKRMDLALSLFERMEERSIISWNAMVAGYNQNGFNLEALYFFARMLKETSLIPDKFTLTSVLSSCANLGLLRTGEEIHGYIVRNQMECNGQVGNALISMYSKSGGVQIAHRVVERIVDSSNLNEISFNRSS